MNLLNIIWGVIFEGVDPALILAGQIYLLFIGTGICFTGIGLFMDLFDDTLESSLGIFEGLTNIFETGDDIVGFHGFGGLTIGSFVTSFGAVGLTLTIYNIGPMISGPVSLITSAIMSVIVFKIAASVFCEANISINEKNIIGQKAIVKVGIQKNGIGSITFNKNGIRTILAVSDNDIKKGTEVTITKIVGTKAYVISD